MTIYIGLTGLILILIFLFVFLILFRWIIILKTTIFYTSDLIERIPDRYVELEITLIESLLKDFMEDDEQVTLDIDTFILIGNSSLFGEKIKSLADANNLNLNIESELKSSITTVRFIKPNQEIEDDNNDDDIDN